MQSLQGSGNDSRSSRVDNHDHGETTDPSLALPLQEPAPTAEAVKPPTLSHTHPDRAYLKLKKKQRHKAWKKRQREIAKQRREMQEARRQKLHAEIDRWQAETNEQDTRRRKMLQEERKMQAAKRRKQKEEKHRIRELRDLIEKAMTLRSLRRKRLEAQGHFFPDEGNAYFEKVQAWNKEMEGKDETIDEQDTPDRPLFVHEEDSWQELPLDHTAYSYWCRGLQSTDDIRQIRKQWDHYIVQDETEDDDPLAKVPPVWVKPAPPSNWVWASYIVNDPDMTP